MSMTATQLAAQFSTGKIEYETPQPLFDEWDAQFNFTLDVAASSSNAKCSCYYTEEDDAMAQTWTGRCWMNPPYGYSIHKWVKKAHDSARDNNALVCCLLPARTETRWFHDYCVNGEVTFLKGRVQFSGIGINAPFPNMIVVFYPQLFLRGMRVQEPSQ